MNGDTCFTIAQYAALRQEIFDSHVQFGTACLIAGFVLASVFWYWRERSHGAVKE